MTYVLAERVRERTLTTGTGTLDLAGVIFANERTFVGGVGDGNTTRYCILSGNGVDWEIGDLALVTNGSPATLARAPIKSTNANAAIDLVGDSQVYCCIPAQSASTPFSDGGDWDPLGAVLQNTTVKFGNLRYVATTNIPAAPAGAPLIDGHAKHNGTTSGTPVTLTLTTSLADDAVIVLIAINGGRTAVPTASGLAFTERADGAGMPIRYTIGGWTIQEFIARAAAPLSSKVITITPSASADFSVVAFGANPVNAVYAWDTNSDHLPLAVAGNTIDCTTDGSRLFLIYLDVSANISFNPTAVPASFTLIESCTYVPAQMGASGRSVTAQQVGVSLVGSATNAVLSFVDALTSENPPPNVDPRWVPLGSSFGDQAANSVYAGPTTGGAAPPGFRALVSADIPATFNGTRTFTGQVVGNFDGVGVRPASHATAGYAITSNYNGNGEVDFWSTVEQDGVLFQGFYFKQKLTPTTHIDLAELYGDGTVTEFDVMDEAGGGVGFGFFAKAGEAGFLAGTIGGARKMTVTVNGLVQAEFPTAGGFMVRGSTSGGVTIKVPTAAGSSTLTLPAGTTDFSATGGAGRALRQLSAGAAITVETTKHDIAFSSPQTTPYTASQVIGHHRAAVAFTIPANFGAHLGRTSQAGGSANATASTVFSVERAVNATPNTFAQIGTITIAAGSVTPTFATSSGTAKPIAQGDVVRIVAPASPDATFAGFYATIAGFET